MAAATFDPITLESILQNLPEVQKRQRRAKKLRAEQERGRAMLDKDAPLGELAQTQQGGLYQTVGSWMPNYGGQAQKLMGGIGEITSRRQAEGAEDELNDIRNQEIIGSVQQMGQEGEGAPGSPTDQTLRAYLGLMGEDVSDIAGKAERLHKTEVLDDGTIVNVYSSGRRENTGQKANWTTRGYQNPVTGEVYNVGTSGAGRGQATQVMAPGSAQPAPPPPGAAPPLPTGGAPAGPPAINIEGMSPEQKQEVQTVISSMQAMQMPQDVIDSYVARAQAKATELPPGQSMGPMTSTVEPMAPEGVPPAPPAPAPGTPLLLGTKEEEAAAAERGKLATQVQMAPQTAAAGAYAKSLEQGAQVDAKTAAEARAKLPAAEQFSAEVDRSIEGLLKHPGLDQVVGTGIWARVAKLPHADKAFNLVMAGSPAADAMARIKQLQGQVFMPAFNTLKGGGQITEQEGIKAQQAMSRMDQAQSPEDFRQAVLDFQTAYREGLEKMRQTAAGQSAAPIPGYTAPAAAAPQRPALPPGFEWED